ncbi:MULTISPECIES: inositol monophosphatase family protein [unclassified Rhodococcus (in: high G+C Gram-positive bacteria)]|uniref:inositol monophosphatase family protein n=1 Tax=unclassified Rhodococcus (in: high G+C Gram-positive bacteria) TaxID=192944 RepID=UPI0007011D81|nr:MULTISPECIES: inositol monophosphatase family protein [unclassified Rhodococcus (in: high G+C Gram-positive bacteria)]KQU31309.1 inositol monophosphatase [Rhodococcus sp. Leaf225]KQU41565.1 inositol monophosphatase [Rhodococcus sp. Leaf258]
MTAVDLDALAATARTLLDGTHERFVAGAGAPSAVAKGPDDFATAVDLELERRLVEELQEQTQIPVHGEEFGGPPVESGTVWVLDPIDGTFNYSFGLPTAGTLLSLLVDGRPVIGLTWLPLIGQRFWAVEGGPVHRDGEALPALPISALASSIVGFGAFNIDSRGRLPGAYRVQVLSDISRVSSRIRMHGSTGLDLAYTAAGTLGASIVFGHHAWDNAAGAMLVRAGGGIVTDLAGEPWTVTSTSVLAAAPGVHEELLQVLAGVGEPSSYTPTSRAREGVRR